jgi:hypothetical protein
MPVFQWFALPNDLGRMVELALSHPKRPQGLCVVERTGRKKADFVARDVVTAAQRQRLMESHCALFMLGKDRADLEFLRFPSPPKPAQYYHVNLNNSNTIIAMFVPTTYVIRGHQLLNHSMLEYNPTKWCSREQRRIKAPRETDLIFRFLKTLIKSVTQSGVEGQLMTDSVKQKMETDGVLIANNRFWYDAAGHVRGTVGPPDGFAELPPQ